MTDIQKQTLDWISDQIDKINEESEDIGEMLLETNDIEIVKVLDEKLQHLEKDLECLFRKFEFEKQQIQNK